MFEGEERRKEERRKVGTRRKLRDWLELIVDKSCQDCGNCNDNYTFRANMYNWD